MHHQCIISASWVHHRCIIMASSGYHRGYFTLSMGHLPNTFCFISPSSCFISPSNLLRFPNKSLCFPNKSLHFPNSLLHFPNTVSHFPNTFCVSLSNIEKGFFLRSLEFFLRFLAMAKHNLAWYFFCGRFLYNIFLPPSPPMRLRNKTAFRV